MSVTDFLKKDISFKRNSSPKAKSEAPTAEAGAPQTDAGAETKADAATGADAGGDRPATDGGGISCGTMTCTGDDLCVTVSSLRFGKRSAIAPPQAPASSIGANWSAAATPTAKPELVSFSTSQVSATVCTQVPETETLASPPRSEQ